MMRCGISMWRYELAGVSDLFYGSGVVLDEGDPGKAGLSPYAGGCADVAGIEDAAVPAFLSGDCFLGEPASRECADDTAAMVLGDRAGIVGVLFEQSL